MQWAKEKEVYIIENLFQILQLIYISFVLFSFPHKAKFPINDLTIEKSDL